MTRKQKRKRKDYLINLKDSRLITKVLRAREIYPNYQMDEERLLRSFYYQLPESIFKFDDRKYLKEELKQLGREDIINYLTMDAEELVCLVTEDYTKFTKKIVRGILGLGLNADVYLKILNRLDERVPKCKRPGRKYIHDQIEHDRFGKIGSYWVNVIKEEGDLIKRCIDKGVPTDLSEPAKTYNMYA